jgi:hypothetical protein
MDVSTSLVDIYICSRHLANLPYSRVVNQPQSTWDQLDTRCAYIKAMKSEFCDDSWSPRVVTLLLTLQPQIVTSCDRHLAQMAVYDSGGGGGRRVSTRRHGGGMVVVAFGCVVVACGTTVVVVTVVEGVNG